MPTIAETLHRAERELAPIAGEDARLEAVAMVAHVLRVDRAHLLGRLADAVLPDALSAFDGLLRRRSAREPLAYIVGRREFYGVDIVCSSAALIPRPETEMLVDFALASVRRRSGTVTVADVGTGTGAIAIAIAANAPNAHIVATDISAEALGLARDNTRHQGVADRIALERVDLLDGLGLFDLIVANLPYVREDDREALPPEIREHEPRLALVGGATGLEIIERLLDAAPAHLAPRGWLAVELGDTQGAAASRIARDRFPAATVCVKKDLAGLDRMLVIGT